MNKKTVHSIYYMNMLGVNGEKYVKKMFREGKGCIFKEKSITGVMWT